MCRIKSLDYFSLHHIHLHETTSHKWLRRQRETGRFLESTNHDQLLEFLEIGGKERENNKRKDKDIYIKITNPVNSCVV